MKLDLTLEKDAAASELPEHVDRVEQRFQQLKVMIHQRLVESLDLSQIDRISRSQMEGAIGPLVREFCGARKEILSQLEYERLVEELMDEVFGLGPLERLMEDPVVSDVLVNGPYTVYVERHGRLELTDVIFADEGHLLRIIQRIVARLGRRIDEATPMVDARLPDGSRVNAVIAPLSLEGPTLSIRRFGVETFQIEDLLANGSLIPDIARFLSGVIQARLGCVFSGGTGAGKTTLLNAVSSFIPAGERIITIEDSAELKLRHRHWVRMETRPANTEGRGEVTQRDLVRNSLRMRPDRIIVGEVRGAEVWDMLQAMNTGHEGSITTVHANSARDALARLEMMVSLTGSELPVPVVRQYIAAGIKLIVHLARLQGGIRRVIHVAEITGVENGDCQIEEVFGYEQTGLDEEGVAQGEFYVTGYRPAFLPRLQACGVHLPEELFRRRRVPDLRPPQLAAAGTAGRTDGAASRAAASQAPSETGGRTAKAR